MTGIEREITTSLRYADVMYSEVSSFDERNVEFELLFSVRFYTNISNRGTSCLVRRRRCVFYRLRTTTSLVLDAANFGNFITSSDLREIYAIVSGVSYDATRIADFYPLRRIS